MCYPVDVIPLQKIDYDAYWHSKRGANMAYLSTFQRRRAEVVARLIRPGATLLDIGCGNGAILAYLREHRQIVEQLIGIDRFAAHDFIFDERSQAANDLAGAQRLTLDLLQPH